MQPRHLGVSPWGKASLKKDLGKEIQGTKCRTKIPKEVTKSSKTVENGEPWRKSRWYDLCLVEQFEQSHAVCMSTVGQIKQGNVNVCAKLIHCGIVYLKNF